MSLISAIRLAARFALGRSRGGTNPIKLILETTRRCNSHCRTCDIWQQSPGHEILPDDLLRAVDSVAGSVQWVALTGGEVTLYPHLPYLVRGLVSRCPELSLINIPLNGINSSRTLALVDEIVRAARRVQFHITLSIDGIDAEQDRLRGAGQWKQTVATWEGLQVLRRIHGNLKVSAQMTVSRLNIGNAFDVIGRFARESDTFIIAVAMENRFYQAMQTPAAGLVQIGEQTSEPAAFELRPSDAEALRKIIRRYPGSGLGSLLEKMFLRGVLRRLRGGSAGVSCVAGDRVLFVAANGDVRPCPFFDESMGRLQDSNFDLRTLAESPGAVSVRAAARDCQKCWNNCVALPSLLASPVKALRLLIGH